MKDQLKELKMGQNSTHEKKSKNGKSKQSNSKKEMDEGGASKEGTQTDENNANGNFVEVLDSDEENGHPMKEENQEDATITKIKYKLGPLLGDTSSEENAEKGERGWHETSSEDDYDQPEGIEGIAEEKRKKAVQNWRRISSKLRSNSLQENEENNIGAREENKISQSEQDIDSLIPGNVQGKAVENWMRLVSKLMDGKENNESPLRTAIMERISNADVSPDKEDESQSGNEGFTRVIENWKRVLSKVLENINEGEESSFKKLVEEMKMGESKGEIALKNWKRITRKLLKKSKRDSLADILKSGVVKNSQSNEQDTESGEMNTNRAIKNWEKLVLQLIHQSTEDEVRDIMQASLNPSSSYDADDTGSLTDNTDVDEESIPLQNWKKLTSKLTDKNRKVDVSMIFQAKEETTNRLSATFSEASDASSVEGEPDNQKAIENWELVVSKVIRKNRVNFINELLKSRLDESRASAQGTDEVSGDEISENLDKWERLVSGILKNSRIWDIKTVIARAKEAGNESSEGENGASETPSRKGSTRRLKAKQHWRSITKKLMGKNKAATFKNGIEDKLRAMQDDKRSNLVKEMGLRAVENWKNIVNKMIENGEPADIFRLKEKSMEADEDLQSLPSTKSDVSRWLDENEKQLRAMKNWKNLSSKLKMITVIGQDMNGNDKEGICPSCKCKYDCPILLSCAHTFCRDCISQLIDNGQGQWFECPTCGAKIKLSENDEELFCPNFIFLREMQHMKSGDDGCRYCGREKKAELICAQCADKYCKDCAPRHTKQEIFENHTLLDLQSAENADKLTKKYYCLKHTKEELTRYCLTCEISVCTKCARKKHKGSKHDCGSVGDAARAGREIVEDATRMLEGVTDFDSDLENIDKMQNDLNVELDEIRNEIKSGIEYLIKKLRERETQLYNEVDRKYETIYDALSKRRADIELAARQTENFRAVLCDLHKHENDVELLQMQATVSERMKDIIELKREQGLYIDYDFVFQPNEKEIESKIDDYGFVSVQDRESKSVIIVEGDENSKGENLGTSIVEDALVTEYDKHYAPSEDDGYDQPRETWSPTVQKREDPKPRQRGEPRNTYENDSDEDEIKNGHHVPRGKKVKHKRVAEKVRGEELPESPVKRTSKISSKTSYEEIKPQVYEFDGLRQPPYEGFTQLTSERGELINVLKYGVRNYKNESCGVEVKMICPDRSIVSAHVAENSDGAFTVFFCPNTKSDFNCFISIGGKCFKKDYKLLNFYGDFKGMKSKEIDLACRALSLLRWHITPGLMENKRGKIKRSRKFMKIIGTQK